LAKVILLGGLFLEDQNDKNVMPVPNRDRGDEDTKEEAKIE
jgi:hypothetical protein